MFAGRFYSSIPLLQTLAEQKTHFTGTIVRNRVDLLDPIRAPFRFGDDESMQFRCERLMVIGWRVKSKRLPVIMISSSHTTAMWDVRNQRGELVRNPVDVDEDNHAMNGVDRNDHQCIYYSFNRKTLKWWRKMFFFTFLSVLL